MGEQIRRRRVLNLIGRVDLKKATVKQWAVIKLLQWQPGAQRIQFEGRCGGHCRSALLMSYLLDGKDQSAVGEEFCGYYCAGCGFSNAGTRPVKREKR